MRQILLTGAGGFVGSRIARLLEGQCRLITFPRGMLSQARAEDVYAFAAHAAPDAIIHTAAIADMGECEKDPEASFRSNVLLTEALCRAAAACGAKIACYSSDQVYNGCRPEDGPYPEDAPLAPVNVYGRHKLEAEERGLAACAHAVMLRATWMYDLPGDGLPIRGNLLMNLLAQAQENRTELFSASDYRGITRVREAAEHTLRALDLPGGSYNFGCPNERSMFDTACDALEALGLPLSLAQRDPSGRARCLAMDPRRLRSLGVAFDSTRDGFFRCVGESASYCKAVKNGI